MKKLGLSLLLILVVCAVAFGATACNRATTEGQIENVFFNLQNGATESYTYDVTNSSNSATGTYKTTIKYFTAGQEVVLSDYNKVTDCGKGYLFTSELTMSDGYSSKTACYFLVSAVSGVTSTFLKPVASYKKVTGSSNDFTEYGSYSGKDYNYTLITSGTKEGHVTVGVKVYDNNEFHNSLRGVNNSIFGSGFSLSFNVPVVTADEQAFASITAKSDGTTNITTNVLDADSNKVSYESYAINISRSTKVAGSSQKIWYAKNDVEFNGFKIRHMITQIVEGSVTYTLKSFALSL